MVLGHRQGADLGQVLPQDMQAAAADDRAGAFGDDEVTHRLVVGDSFLLKEHALLGKGGDQRPHRSDIGRAGGPNDDLVRPLG